MTLNMRVADDQLGAYYRRTAAIADRLGKSLDFDSVMKGLQLIHDGKLKGLSIGESKLLERVATVAAPSEVEFSGKDAFRVNIEQEGVKIAYVDHKFAKDFIPIVDRDIPAGELKFYKLLKRSLNAPVFAELGDNCETYLSDLWRSLERQPNGERSPFLITGVYSNVFYIRDVYGVLRVVTANWTDLDAWAIYVDSPELRDMWSIDTRFIAR